MPTHAVVWIDHKEARVFHVHPDSTDQTTSGQIVASARRYFRGIDRLAGRSPIAT